MVFFDTNIFVYAVSAAETDRPNTETALRLISGVEFGTSIQVVQEFMDVALRKKHLGLTPEEISEMVDLIATYPLAETSLALARQAFQIRSRFQLRYWDAAIIAAAQELGCSTLYSEDFSHDQDYGGVRVINPFLARA